MGRKALRLPDYDYSQPGAYFLTLCAKGKANLFGRICVGGGVSDAPWPEYTGAGMAVQEWLGEMNRHYQHICLRAYVIMPNHIHVLVEVVGPSGTPAPTRANQTIPAFVSALKRLTNRACKADLWQDGYYDHVIRDDADFLRVWNYIHTNPARWAEDPYFVR